MLSRFLLYMIEDTFLLFRVLFYVIEDVLFPYSTFYLNIEDGDCMCMCICVCIRVVGYFPPVSCASFLSPFEEGLHRVSRYTSGTNPPPRKLDFPLVTTPYRSFVTTTPRRVVRVLFSTRRSYPFDVSHLSPAVRVALTLYTFVS